jgi:putative DNA primase/helicase
VLFDESPPHYSQKQTLYHQSGQFYSHNGTAYDLLEDAAILSKLFRYLEHAKVRKVTADGKFREAPFPLNSRTAKDALDAIRIVAHLPNTIQAPAWLDNDPINTTYDPRDMLICKTAYLHMPTLKRIEPTPDLFVTNALGFDYDAEAPAPSKWLAFLQQLWPGDNESIQLIQDWFGYCLTGDTRLQKMLLIVGPRRSGKGTIASVLTSLLGAVNVTGPTTGSLVGEFGLQPLIGKSLAIVADARFAGQDIQTLVERLLCLSGGDSLTINRKNLVPVTMKLSTRLMFLTNEIPRFTDSSSALPGRMVMVKLTQSFYGKEDIYLQESLQNELPGILNWAIAGWKRLAARGRFVQPASVTELVQEMEDLASPVNAFVKEWCEVDAGIAIPGRGSSQGVGSPSGVGSPDAIHRNPAEGQGTTYRQGVASNQSGHPDGPGITYQIGTTDLFNAWKRWCKINGRDYASNAAVFGRDLMSSNPMITKSKSRETGYSYSGIRLRDEYVER